MEKPVLINKEIEELYRNDLTIGRGIYKKIMDLPRETLIKDLETVLRDAKRIYKTRKRDIDANFQRGKDEYFVIHSMFLLGELRAEESLDVVLDFLKKEEFVYFWLEDVLSENLWELMYYLGRNQLQKLSKFVKDNKNYTYSRTEITKGIAQLALQEPERRDEVIEWYRDIFRYFIKNADNKKLIDVDLTSLMAYFLIEIKCVELLEEIKELYLEDLIDIEICNSYKQIKRICENNKSKIKKYKLMNFMERNRKIKERWIRFEILR